MAAGHLAAAAFEDGERLVLALVGVPAAAEAAVVAAVDEAVRFSGAEAVRLEVLFAARTLRSWRLARVGLTFRPARAAEAQGTPQLQ